MSPMATLERATAGRWLSSPRLGVYLQATANDLDAAMELYDWNAAVTAACFRDVGHFEVLLRNRYAEELQKHYPDWTRATSTLWTLENGYEGTKLKQRAQNRASRKALEVAKELAPHPTPGHIVANLTFGFWVSLTKAPRTSTIWALVNPVFGGKTRGAAHDYMMQLNTFRNRLAHSEPVFSTTTGLASRLTELHDLLTLLDPDVTAWIGARSQVVAVLAKQPTGQRITLPNYLSGTV